MYSIDEIKELISALDGSSLTELKLKNSEGEVCLKKQVTVSETVRPILSVPVEAAPIKEETVEENFDVISSPMVGVFYAAPSPDSKPFVTVGQTVVKDETVVCIVEAMKIYNEITADRSGVITEVCVNNGDIVEFGQPLFKIK